MKIFEILTNEDENIKNFLRTYNEEKYYHWHKFQRVDKPDAYTYEEFWHAIGLIRATNRIYIILNDTKFSFKIPNFLLEKLHFIDLHLGGSIIIDDLVPAGAEARYLRSSLIEEAIASSQIEGAATTRKRAKEMFDNNETPKNNDEQMIFNNLLAMQYISAHKEEEITEEKILELHAILTKNTLKNPKDEGIWRYDNEIVVEDSLTHEILHTPPEYQKIPKYITSLIQFFNSPGKDFIHPVVKGIVIHFFIGWIHPFVDGNGRTARALFYWYILKNGYWLTEFISISRSIKEHTEQYKQAYLCTETDQNDLTYFLDYNIKCLLLSLEKFKQYIQKKMQEEKNMIQKIQLAHLTKRQADIVKFFEQYSGRDFTILELTREFSISRNTMKKEIDILVEKGFVQQIERNAKTKSYIKI